MDVRPHKRPSRRPEVALVTRALLLPGRIPTLTSAVPREPKGRISRRPSGRVRVILAMEPLPLWKVFLPVLVVVGLIGYWTIWPTPFRRILRLFVLAEVLYAMLQDQFTVRLCLDHFTVNHP